MRRTFMKRTIYWKWLVAILLLTGFMLLRLVLAERVSPQATAQRFHVAMQKLPHMGFETLEVRGTGLALEDLPLLTRLELALKQFFRSTPAVVVTGFLDRSEIFLITNGPQRFECVLHYNANTPIAVSIRYPTGFEELARQLQSVFEVEKVGVPVSRRLAPSLSSPSAVKSSQQQ